MREREIYILWLLTLPQNPFSSIFIFSLSEIDKLRNQTVSAKISAFFQSGHINGHRKSLTLLKTRDYIIHLMIGCFKDPTYALMRVLLCKIQCPSFICFCKPSPHIYAAGSLKLENTPEIVVSEEDANHVDAFVKEEKCSVDEKEEEEEEEEEEEKEEEVEVESSVEILKSSFKKAVLYSTDDEKREKKKVQWSDLMGKELAQIREFQSSEEDDIDYDGVKSCVCVIL